MADIIVRPIATVEEYQACQEIQRRAWGITDDSYVVPVATMISVQHAGGLVLGAFDGDVLAGFSFAYLGRVRGQWALYSQLTGVNPDVQDRGVGRLLKLYQRDWARQQGLALVVWSFDPMQRGNANFNFNVLGAFCRAYEPNYFGERSDTLSAGLDSDRLICEWPVEGSPYHLRETMPPLALVASPVSGAPPPFHVDEAVRQAVAAQRNLTIAVPWALSALREQAPAAAREWQASVRAAFSFAFAEGYIAVAFGQQRDHIPACWYTLCHAEVALSH